MTIVPFLIFTMWVGVIGPGHIEGGFDAISDKGAVPALKQAWQDRDASTLTGNYGNK